MKPICIYFVGKGGSNEFIKISFRSGEYAVLHSAFGHAIVSAPGYCIYE